MNERIDLHSLLNRAHWRGNFSCSDQALMVAVRASHSTEVGVVGLYLATRYALDSFDVSNAACPLLDRHGARREMDGGGNLLSVVVQPLHVTSLCAARASILE